MNCIQCKEYLLEYAEGTLSDSLQKEVQAHIDACPACAEEAALFAEMTDILRDMPEVELPEGYHAELMQKIQKESKTVLPFPSAKKRNWKNIGLVAAAVLLIAAAGGVQGIQKLRTAQESVVAETTQQSRISEDITQEHIENAENSKESAISETPQTQEQNMTTQEPTTPKTLTQQSNDAVSETNNEQVAQPKTTIQETTIQETTPQETTSKPQVVMVEESQMAAQPQTVQEAPAASESGSGAEMANAGISMMRAAQDESYQATLTVTDIEQSIQTVRETMLDLGGIEQTSTENSITMTIASDKTEEVFAQLQKLGTLQEPEIAPTQQDTITLTILLQQE